MEYKFSFSYEASINEQISQIVEICDNLDAEEKAVIFDFGANHDLVLHIYKDSDFVRDAEEDYNLVRISTARDGKWLDDTEDTYVTDGSLRQELERIWHYKDFSNLEEEEER